MSSQGRDDTIEAASLPEGVETDDETSATHDELAMRVAVLEAENRTLRNGYARARQITYRRTAIALTAIGLVALAGGLVFPADRAVFVVLGAIGIFGGVLTYYLTPDWVVPAMVGERVYTALATNLAEIATDLGLKTDFVYVPAASGRPSSVRLFIPLFRNYEIPSTEEGPLVLEGDDRGLLLEPTGAVLFREFDQARTTPLAETPSALASQLCDGLVEQFELAKGATPDVDAADGRITVAVAESAFGDVDRFDHPVPSYLAVGVALGLGVPVMVDVSTGENRAQWLVTCRYEHEPDEGK